MSEDQIEGFIAGMEELLQHLNLNRNATVAELFAALDRDGYWT